MVFAHVLRVALVVKTVALIDCDCYSGQPLRDPWQKITSYFFLWHNTFSQWILSKSFDFKDKLPNSGQVANLFIEWNISSCLATLCERDLRSVCQLQCLLL